MPEVDPDDDTIWRITLRHYTYDPVRRERRHVDVVTFDTEREFFETLERLHRDLEERRNRGTDEPLEHYTGVPKEPGYEARRVAGKKSKWVGRAMVAREALQSGAPRPTTRVRKRRQQ